jgi:hypothetical protein
MLKMLPRTLSQLKEVLLSVNDSQTAISLEPANIASVKPSIICATQE